MVSVKGVLRSLRAFKIALHVKNIDIRHRFPFFNRTETHSLVIMLVEVCISTVIKLSLLFITKFLI